MSTTQKTIHHLKPCHISLIRIKKKKKTFKKINRPHFLITSLILSMFSNFDSPRNIRIYSLSCTLTLQND